MGERVAVPLLVTLRVLVCVSDGVCVTLGDRVPVIEGVPDDVVLRVSELDGVNVLEGVAVTLELWLCVTVNVGVVDCELVPVALRVDVPDGVPLGLGVRVCDCVREPDVDGEAEDEGVGVELGVCVPDGLTVPLGVNVDDAVPEALGVSVVE